MYNGLKIVASCIFLLLKAGGFSIAQGVILQPESYKHYIDSFNTHDQELYPQFIPNDHSWEFLSKNIPLLDCPDSMIQQTWYFRWWTFRKHIKKTPGGFVILEFLPDVGWAGKYNTINCAAAHHFYEGRWLHDPQYLDDYAKFWYRGGGDMQSYSCWMADAIWNRTLVTNDLKMARELNGDLIRNYRIWEKLHLDSNGLYWQIDGRDGMEVSISGGKEEALPAYRATINSYCYGDAMAIASIASLSGNSKTAALFRSKAARIKKQLQHQLWDDKAGFFKVLSRPDSGPAHDSIPGSHSLFCTARELHGYTPWYFNLPSEKYTGAWKFLMDPKCFYAPFGPTTAEQDHPGFRISYEGHECQWNGPSWPFATSVTLTSLANVLNNYKQKYITREDYFTLLKNYANAHRRKTEDGKELPWIDEDLNPFTGDWISRTRLRTWENGGWPAEKGGPERGKDYNHSTFCDLIITGLIGLRPQQGNTVVINPLLPASTWDYFCLDNLLYHGRILTILYDRDGSHYHKGSGLQLFIDGGKAAFSPSLKRLQVTMEKKPLNRTADSGGSITLRKKGKEQRTLNQKNKSEK